VTDSGSRFKAPRVLCALARESWAVVKETAAAWSEDNVFRMSAALAFYATFSVAPALLIGLSVAGAFVGRVAAKSELAERIAQFVTPEVATHVVTVVDTLWSELTRAELPVIGMVSALLAATAVFAELRSSLNTIWGVTPNHKQGLLKILYERAVSFALVVGTGIVLLVFATASTALSIVNALFATSLPMPEFVVKGLHLFIAEAMVPALLVLVYKFVPEAPVAWRDVWLGTLVTAVLFFVGKYAFAMYLRSSIMLSVYGAAGSLIVFLVWVYYSSQVFFLGAELTKVYAARYGSLRHASHSCE